MHCAGISRASRPSASGQADHPMPTPGAEAIRHAIWAYICLGRRACGGASDDALGMLPMIEEAATNTAYTPQIHHLTLTIRIRKSPHGITGS
jgi:hypothetical protein